MECEIEPASCLCYFLKNKKEKESGDDCDYVYGFACDTQQLFAYVQSK